MHGVLRVKHEVEDDLLEFALVAVDAGEVGVEGGLEADLTAVLNWCSRRVVVSRRSWLRSIEVNSEPEVREKLRRPLTISEARKVCWVIFSRTGEMRASSRRDAWRASGCRTR